MHSGPHACPEDAHPVLDHDQAGLAAAGRLRSQVESGRIVLAVARPGLVITGVHEHRLASWLDAQERARHRAFRFARDQQLYLAAHGLMRALLSECTGIPPEALSIEKDRWGKPQLVGPAKEGGPIHFSLSHTHGLVACAACRWSQVGIDVEETTRADLDVLALSGVLTASERRRLESMPPAARAKEFVSSWTLKEAYSKARGLGLRLSFADFGFRLADGRAPQIEFEDGIADDPRRWCFSLDAVGTEHVLALASGRPGPQAVEHYAWEADEADGVARFYFK